MRWILATLAVLAVAPVASADHVYTHRYLVLVHAADGSGNPLEHVAVDATVDFASEGACAPRPTSLGTEHPARRATTGADGLAVVCVHAHAIPEGRSVRALASGLDGSVAADPFTRLTVVRIVGSGEGRTASDLLVHARAWDAGNQTIEGVPAGGAARAGVEVTLAVRFDGESEITRSERTDAYGDVLFRIPRSQASGTATLRGNGGETTLAIAPTTGFLSATLPLASPAPSFLELASKPDRPVTIPGAPAALAALAVVAFGAVRRAR